MLFCKNCYTEQFVYIAPAKKPFTQLAAIFKQIPHFIFSFNPTIITLIFTLLTTYVEAEMENFQLKYIFWSYLLTLNFFD